MPIRRPNRRYPQSIRTSGVGRRDRRRRREPHNHGVGVDEDAALQEGHRGTTGQVADRVSGLRNCAILLTGLAFVWNGDQQSNFDIYVRMVDDTATLRLTTSAATDYNPIWSPDGRFIAFLRSQDGSKADILLIPSTGAQNQRSQPRNPQRSAARVDLAPRLEPRRPGAHRGGRGPFDPIAVAVRTFDDHRREASYDPCWRSRWAMIRRLSRLTVGRWRSCEVQRLRRVTSTSCR